MEQSFQLPSLNALVSADKDVLRMIFKMLAAEINELRREVDVLQTEARRGRGY
jgi:hypothetical protein